MLSRISERDGITILISGRSNKHIRKLAVNIDSYAVGRFRKGRTPNALTKGVFELDSEAVVGRVGTGTFVPLELLEVHAALAGDVALFDRVWEGGGGEGEGGEEGGDGELHGGWFALGT